MTDRIYVHGYDRLESVRLQDQAETLVDLLHSDTSYPEGSSVLEAGCGTGAQTIPLARNSPGARITSVDISAVSVAEAKAKANAAGLTNVQFQQADISALPFRPGILRPCLRLFRPGAPFASSRGPGQSEEPPEARRDDHGHRGGPWFDLFPSPQRGRPCGYPLPGRAAAGCGRQCSDRAAALSAAAAGRVRGDARLAADGVCGFEQAGFG